MFRFFLILLRSVICQAPRRHWFILRHTDGQQWFSLGIQESFFPKKLLTLFIWF